VTKFEFDDVRILATSGVFDIRRIVQLSFAFYECEYFSPSSHPYMSSSLSTDSSFMVGCIAQLVERWSSAGVLSLSYARLAVEW